MKKILFIFFAILFLCGCVTLAERVNSVTFGMTEIEVYYVLGDPISSSLQNGVKYLRYDLSEPQDSKFFGVLVPYYVRLTNGKVDSYGRFSSLQSSLSDKQKRDLKLY